MSEPDDRAGAAAEPAGPGPAGPEPAGPEPDGAVLAELVAVLRERAADPPPGSYSATLLSDPERAQRKIMEEAFELCLELGREPVDVERAASEAADVVFHVLAGLVGAGVPWPAVLAELAERRGAPPRAAASDSSASPAPSAASASPSSPTPDPRQEPS